MPGFYLFIIVVFIVVFVLIIFIDVVVILVNVVIDIVIEMIGLHKRRQLSAHDTGSGVFAFSRLGGGYVVQK